MSEQAEQALSEQALSEQAEQATIEQAEQATFGHAARTIDLDSAARKPPSRRPSGRGTAGTGGNISAWSS